MNSVLNSKIITVNFGPQLNTTGKSLIADTVLPLGNVCIVLLSPINSPKS